ncbi:MAG: monofunctional biosynthetic peptidoglycan transglycosylase [Burkholderiaceae bacterium]
MRRLWRWLRWPIGLLVGLVLVAQLFFFAQVGWLRFVDPTTTSFMRAEQARLSMAQSRPVVLRHRWVDYSRISSQAKRAVVAAEDSGFTQHDGIDWEAIEKAAKDNLRKGKIKRGGSTITMQLAKNLFLSSERSFVRKAQEVVLTGMLELVHDKRRLLELYLNVAEWGVGVFGIEAAAQHYFGIPAAALTAEQSAWLAAILPAPRRYDRNRQSDWLQEKSIIILERMPKVAIP